MKALFAASSPRAGIAALLFTMVVSSSAAADAPRHASAEAASEPSSEDQAPEPLLPFRSDLHGVLTWEGELGAGLRIDIPVFGKTRLYRGRDEISVSVGTDVSFLTFAGHDRVTVWPTATMQWSFAVSRRFTFYPELGIVAQIHPGDFKGLFPNVGFGGRFAIHRSVAVHLRLGWPMAFSVGITF